MQNEDRKDAEQTTRENEGLREKETRARYLKYAFFVFLGLVILSAWWGAYMTIMASQH